MNQIRQEILQYNYWEHYKHAKDLARTLPIDHPKRVDIQKHMDEILKELNQS